MRIHGIWPGFRTRKVGLARFSCLPAAVMIILFVNYPQTVQLFRVGGDLNAIVKILTTSNVPIGIALFKFLGVSYNQDGMYNIIHYYCSCDLIFCFNS